MGDVIARLHDSRERQEQVRLLVDLLFEFIDHPLLILTATGHLQYVAEDRGIYQADGHSSPPARTCSSLLAQSPNVPFVQF